MKTTVHKLKSYIGRLYGKELLEVVAELKYLITSGGPGKKAVIEIDDKYYSVEEVQSMLLREAIQQTE